MGPIAVIGAGGFVGSRLIESLVLGGDHNIRAVIRSYRSLAGLSRFGSTVPVALADAEDASALGTALRGCAVAVNLTTGAPSGILRTTRAIHDACVAANVGRLIHLSSAVVYGEDISPSIDDDSPPATAHWMPYARAKSAAELWLRNRMHAGGPCQVAILRPGIVWGVRSPHTMSAVTSLLDKSAYLVDGGTGVFNSIHVDNLVACIRACRGDDGDVTGCYNVADAETLTWRDFYAGFADFCQYDLKRIPSVSGERFSWSVPASFDYVQSLPLMNEVYHVLKTRLPDSIKSHVKAALSGEYQYETTASSYAASPRIDRELWHLQQVTRKLPTDKFARRFDFTPPLSFAKGVCRTLAWLDALRIHSVEDALVHSS